MEFAEDKKGRTSGGIQRGKGGGRGMERTEAGIKNYGEAEREW